MRRCGNCKLRKPKSDFYIRKSGRRSGLPLSYCKPCANEMTKKRREENGYPDHSPYNAKKKFAKKNGIPFLLSKQDFERILRVSRCFYCGVDARDKGIDRIIPGVGYEKSNCVVACKTCNSTKYTKTRKELIATREKLTRKIAILDGIIDKL